MDNNKQTAAEILFDIIKSFSNLNDITQYALDQGWDPDFIEDEDSEPYSTDMELEVLMSEIHHARHLADLTLHPSNQIKILLIDKYNVVADTIHNAIYSDDSCPSHTINY
jgi:hypothetical protein